MKTFLDHIICKKGTQILVSSVHILLLCFVWKYVHTSQKRNCDILLSKKRFMFCYKWPQTQISKKYSHKQFHKWHWDLPSTKKHQSIFRFSQNLPSDDEYFLKHRLLLYGQLGIINVVLSVLWRVWRKLKWRIWKGHAVGPHMKACLDMMAWYFLVNSKLASWCLYKRLLRKL